MSGGAIAAAQVPPPGGLVLDHVAHFVPDLEAAAAALAAMGFALTPRSEQHNARPDGTRAPAGAANRCVMLEAGYLEFLTPVAPSDGGETPIAAELCAAMARHRGLHLLAFGSADIAADRRRLDAAGFAPLPPVALRRAVATADGETEARFTVLRVPAGTMTEGRVQFVHHHTPDAIWQARWLDHANGAVGLAGAIVAADDPAAAAARYARFTGRSPSTAGAFAAIATDRGALRFMTPRDAAERFGLDGAAAGRFTAALIACRDVGRFATAAAAAGCTLRRQGGAACIALPPALGGAWIAVAADGDLPG